jgi:hypothetical protein
LVQTYECRTKGRESEHDLCLPTKIQNM